MSTHEAILSNPPTRVAPRPAIERNLAPPSKAALDNLFAQVIQRRPYIAALALTSPGGRLWAAAMPDGVEEESVAAMAAPVALLGRRVSLEQLGADMRQAYVEGEGGYAVLRTIGEAAILLTIAYTDANLALVLHDIESLEKHVAHVMGLSAEREGEWSQAASSIDQLRRLVSEGQTPGIEQNRLDNLREKLASLDLGFFPERVAALRARLEGPQRDLDEIEAEVAALEQDVTEALERDMSALAAATVEAPVEQDGRQNYVRRMLKWLASMIESGD